jgi:hypothetical protein
MVPSFPCLSLLVVLWECLVDLEKMGMGLALSMISSMALVRHDACCYLMHVLYCVDAAVCAISIR